jgi:hypothetical protein
MAKSRPDDDDEDDRSRERSRPERRKEEYDDEDDVQPRRRKRQGGGLSRVIPYHNARALAAYYCGFGGLICILGSVALSIVLTGDRRKATGVLSAGFGLGAVLALAAIVLGILGLTYVTRNPEAKGMAHAVTGVVLGIMEIIALLGLLIIA